MAKQKSYNQKIKSEIEDKSGAYTDTALLIDQDAKKVFSRLFKKHEGKVSVTALHTILGHALFHEYVFQKALSIKM